MQPKTPKKIVGLDKLYQSVKLTNKIVYQPINTVWAHVDVKENPSIYFYAPLEKAGHSVLQLSVGRLVGRSVGMSVGLSVCRPSVVRSISFDPFTWSIPYLVQGLPSLSRWSLLIFRSHAQSSRSNHSSQPTVLSDQYLLTLEQKLPIESR